MILPAPHSTPKLRKSLPAEESSSLPVTRASGPCERPWNFGSRGFDYARTSRARAGGPCHGLTFWSTPSHRGGIRRSGELKHMNPIRFRNVGALALAALVSVGSTQLALAAPKPA